jgi:hypothetical protein
MPAIPGSRPAYFEKHRIGRFSEEAAGGFLCLTKEEKTHEHYP